MGARPPQRPVPELLRVIGTAILELAAQLEGSPTTTPAPVANDTAPKKKRGGRRGPVVPSQKALEALGISDTDRQAAARIAETRGMMRNTR